MKCDLYFRPASSLVVSHWKLRLGTYGWVTIQPSQPKQAILWTGFDFSVFFCRILQFLLVLLLTCHWTYCIKNCLCIWFVKDLGRLLGPSSPVVYSSWSGPLLLSVMVNCLDIGTVLLLYLNSHSPEIISY